MLRYVPIVIVFGLTIYSFFDVLATDRARFASLNKPTWLLVVLLPLIGPLLWLLVGRRHRQAGSDRVIQIRRRDRPVAPDDDPAFLRQLDEQAWRARREAKRRESDQAPGAAGSGGPAPEAAGGGTGPDEAAPGSPPDAESADPAKPPA